jgi:hypothetical protein
VLASSTLHAFYTYSINGTFRRNMTEENKSILTILFMHNSDLINITSSTLCGSTLYVIVFSSMSYVTAQILWAIILAFGTLTTELP